MSKFSIIMSTILCLVFSAVAATAVDAEEVGYVYYQNGIVAFAATSLAFQSDGDHDDLFNKFIMPLTEDDYNKKFSCTYAPLLGLYQGYYKKINGENHYVYAAKFPLWGGFPTQYMINCSSWESTGNYSCNLNP